MLHLYHSVVNTIVTIGKHQVKAERSLWVLVHLTRDENAIALFSSAWYLRLPDREEGERAILALSPLPWSKRETGSLGEAGVMVEMSAIGQQEP